MIDKGPDVVGCEATGGFHTDDRRSLMFARLGAWCARRNKVVLAAWVLLILAGGALSSSVGNAFSTDFALPDVESARGIKLLEKEMSGMGSGMQGTIVMRSDKGFDDPDVRSQIDSYLSKVAKIKGVTVQSPWDPQMSDPNSPMIRWMLSGVDNPVELTSLSSAETAIVTQGPLAGKLAYATVWLPSDYDMDHAVEIGHKIIDSAPSIKGTQFEFGGDFFQDFEPPASELLGLASAIVILIIAFGSVLAMGLPIGVALAGIGLGSVALALVSNLVVIPEITTTMGVMIGLGVGIDYALFIVTRYREQLNAGHTIEESVAIAIDTSGRAVTFAGLTVVISLLGMLTIGISFVSGLGIGTATVVLVTMIASLTLLPALLGLAGKRVNVTRWRGLVLAALVALTLLGAGLRAERTLADNPFLKWLVIAGYILVILGALIIPRLQREVPVPKAKPLRQTKAYKWSRFVQSHPWKLAIGSTVLLVLMAAPLLGIRLGFSDAGNLPKANTGRKAYDLLSQGFGAGSNGKLILAAEVPKGFDLSTPKDLIPISKMLNDVPGVASAGPPIPSNMEDPAASKAILWTVVPKTSPQAAETAGLVHRLRTDVVPGIEKDFGIRPMVSGQVAVSVDFAEYLGERLFLFFGVVLALSFALLMAVFRSVLVPLKAVLMNLLSIGASYGMIVAIFQWGWGSSIFKIEPAPIEPFIPMMLFAIVFGLSMDYEVFLLSRVREEWTRTSDSRSSVADGLAATARVITAAAAIMVFVFGSFVFEAERIVKLMGFGLAFAVLLDATVVRMLLVPATMELLGDRNWWIPRWLNRIIPTINVEGPVEIDLDTGQVDYAEPDPGRSKSTRK